MASLLRKYATPLCIAVFVLIGCTGSLLFFGVHSHELIEFHEWVGITFVVIAILHLVRNWRSLGILLRQKANPWIIGIIAVAGLVYVSQSVVSPGPGRGSPVRGSVMLAQQMAQQPLEKMAGALGMSEPEVIGRLAKGGVTIAAKDRTLADISASSGWQVGQLFLLLTNSNNGGNGGGGARHRRGNSH